MNRKQLRRKARHFKRKSDWLERFTHRIRPAERRSYWFWGDVASMLKEYMENWTPIRKSKTYRLWSRAGDFELLDQVRETRRFLQGRAPLKRRKKHPTQRNVKFCWRQYCNSCPWMRNSFDENPLPF